VAEVAQILAISADRIDPARSLHDLGLDSLMAVELALGLEQRFGIQLPVMMLNESPTAEKVTQRIVEKLLGSTDQADTAANAVDTVVQGMTQQHGETLAAEDIQQIAADARALQKQGTRLTA
jgi:acyl carrier protein